MAWFEGQVTVLDGNGAPVRLPLRRRLIAALDDEPAAGGTIAAASLNAPGAVAITDRFTFRAEARDQYEAAPLLAAELVARYGALLVATTDGLLPGYRWHTVRLVIDGDEANVAMGRSVTTPPHPPASFVTEQCAHSIASFVIERMRR